MFRLMNTVTVGDERRVRRELEVVKPIRRPETASPEWTDYYPMPAWEWRKRNRRVSARAATALCFSC